MTSSNIADRHCLPTVPTSVETFAHLCIVGARLQRVKTKTPEFPAVFRHLAYPDLVRKLERQQLPRIGTAADRHHDVLLAVEHVGQR